MRATWVLTVPSPMWRRPASSQLLWPRARSFSTSSSRLVRDERFAVDEPGDAAVTPRTGASRGIGGASGLRRWICPRTENPIAHANRSWRNHRALVELPCANANAAPGTIDAATTASDRGLEVRGLPVE